jgi:hypothetical protein
VLGVAQVVQHVDGRVPRPVVPPEPADLLGVQQGVQAGRLVRFWVIVYSLPEAY